MLLKVAPPLVSLDTVGLPLLSTRVIATCGKVLIVPVFDPAVTLAPVKVTLP